MDSIEIFVLNYNGRDLLEQCLPSLVKAVESSAVPCILTVIDNHSRDGSVDFLREHFKSVRIVALQDNRVLCAFNQAVRDSGADIVFLLNNDLKVEPNFIAPLLEAFKNDPSVFLAAPKSYTFDLSRYEGSLSKMEFSSGMIRVESRFEGFEKKIDTAGFTMQAGFGAYRRDIFLKLGGFDELYLPGTVEDTDLCFRAWKAGYTCRYVPESLVYHKGQASFKKYFNRSRLLAINQRNLHLFIWKNISSKKLLLRYFAWYAVRPILFLLKGRFEFLWGALWAWRRMGQALQKRKQLKIFENKRSDDEILAISRGI
jgi:GT2 family glycosyltransferase